MNAAAPAISVALFGVSDLNHWLLTRISDGGQVDLGRRWQTAEQGELRHRAWPR